MVTNITTNFISGEVSSDFDGAYGLDAHKNGASYIQNFVIESSGQARYRTGTKYIAQTYENKKARLIPLRLDDGSLYIVELTAGYMRFFKDGVVLESELDIGIYNEDEIYEVQFQTVKEGITYFTHVNYEPRRLVSLGVGLWEFGDYPRVPASIFTLADEYPSCCYLHDGRLIFASSKKEPLTVWFSKLPNTTTGLTQYDNFDTGTSLDTDGIKFILSAGNPSIIRWITSTDKNLVIGCYGNIVTLNKGITASNVQASVVAIGCSSIPPSNVSTSVFFSERGSRNLRSFDYDYFSSGYKPVDRTLLSRNLTEGGIRKITYAEGFEPKVYFLTNDGYLNCLTYIDSTSVTSPLYRFGFNDEVVFDVQALSRVNNYDRVFVIVSRLVEGEFRYYLEYFEDNIEFPRFEEYYTGDEAEDNIIFDKDVYQKQRESYFVDCGATFDNSFLFDFELSGLEGVVTLTCTDPVFDVDDLDRYFFGKSFEASLRVVEYVDPSTLMVSVEFAPPSTSVSADSFYFANNFVTGLDHLEGREVAICSDGGVHPSRIVVDGRVDFNYYISVASVGLAYTGILKTLPLTTMARTYTFGKLKSISKVSLRLSNSLAGKVGTNIYGLRNMLYRSLSSILSRPPKLFNGYKEEPIVKDRPEVEKSIILVQDSPLPFNVQAIVYEAEQENEL